jgi:hypothetical protein
MVNGQKYNKYLARQFAKTTNSETTNPKFSATIYSIRLSLRKKRITNKQQM